MQSNADKYPSELCRGSSAKYTSYNRGCALFPCATSRFDIGLVSYVIRLVGWLRHSKLSLSACLARLLCTSAAVKSVLQTNVALHASNSHSR